MPNRITILNNTSLVSSKNMSSKVIQYNVDFIYQFSHRIQRELPVEVMKTLNLSTKIKAVMNDNDLKIFNKKLDNFDVEVLKKKINSLLNKLTSANFDGIYQKVEEILKNRKVLIEFTIKSLMTYAIQMPMLVETYAKFYQKIYTKETEQIFQDTLEELMSVLNGKAESDINSAKDYEKFCKYIKDKGKYTGLHIFLVSLFKLKLIKKKQIVSQLKCLVETILKSTPEENEKFAETYIKMITKLGSKKFITIKGINEIKNAKVVSMRMKFALSDLQDLYKCDFCKKDSCRTCSNLKKCSKN